MDRTAWNSITATSRNEEEDDDDDDDDDEEKVRQGNGLTL